MMIIRAFSNDNIRVIRFRFEGALKTIKMMMMMMMMMVN